jgi:heme exporter protein D
MNWPSFFNMGGYAFYVWGSYGLAIVAIAVEIVFLVLRKRTLRHQLGLTRESTHAKQNETTS